MYLVWLDALPLTGADQACVRSSGFLLHKEKNADRGNDKYEDPRDSQVHLDDESYQEAKHWSDQTEKRDAVLDNEKHWYRFGAKRILHKYLC